MSWWLNMRCPSRLTPAQRKEALILYSVGYVIWPLSYRGLTRHKPLRSLENMGLAHVDWGPPGSWLFTYCYLPVWSDPVC